MSNEYIGVVTLAGQAAIAGSIGGTPLSLTTVRVGDSNGLPITPNETMTDLVRRVGAAYGIAASGRDPSNPTMWRITAVIPAADGPFDIREIGVFDSTGTLIALAKHPFVEKRSPAQGNAVELTTDIVFPISDTAQITINLLPDVAVHIGQMLRAPFLVVESATTTAPPATPALGATYVIPSTGATGAWAGAGLANRLAQWTGEVWAAVDVPIGHMVAAQDRTDSGRYLSRNVSGWGPSLPRAVQSGAWNYAVAGGTANALTATFDPVPSVLADGQPARLLIPATNTGPVALNGDPLRTMRGAELAQGDLPAGSVMSALRRGAEWRLAGISYSEPVAGSLIDIRVFTANDTYTPTAGTRFILLEGCGGGGAGGGLPALGVGSFGVGGGGSCGAYARARYTSGFGSVAVTIGSGGVGSQVPGGNGGTTSFGALLTLPGGNGGQNVATNLSTGIFTAAPGLPGGGATGTGIIVSISGGVSPNDAILDAGSGLMIAGHGATCPLGLGGGPGSPSSAVGYGAGGGGRQGTQVAAQNGGNGAPGILIIHEYA